MTEFQTCFRLKLGLAASLVALSMSTTAIAQTAPGSEPAEADESVDIVVTARKTDEKLLDVPIAISALTSEQLEQIGARSLDEVSRFTPGFNFERTIGTLAQPTIRGQAQTRITNAVQNVASFFNGVYLQRSYQIDSDLLDIERVEVIKGPQSALFGRNAFAGAISIVTKRPDLEKFRAQIEGTIGNRERRELRGSVSVPIGGIAGISIAGSISDFDGTWRNQNTGSAALQGSSLRTKGRLNGFRNRSLLGQITIEPTDNLKIDAFWSYRDIFIESAATYQFSNNSAITRGSAFNCTPFIAPLSPARVGTNGLFCGALPTTPPVAAGDPRRPGLLVDRRSYGQDGESNVAGATVVYDLTDEISFTYQFGYTDADATNVATLSADPLNGSPSPFFLGQVLFDARGNGDINSKTSELRAEYTTDRLRVLLGGFVGTVDDFSFGGTAFLAPNTTTDVFANITTPISGFGATQRDERNRAIFGLVSYELVDGLRIAAEGRQSWERVTQQGVTATGALTGARFQKEFRFFTPRFTVDYKPSENWLVYASAARGSKVGGFNVPTPTNPLTPAQQVFLPEFNWTYELGVKGTLLNRALTVEASVFHSDVSKLQGNLSVNMGQPAIVRNLAGADVDGFEFSAVIRPNRAITVNLGLAYVNSRFVNGTVDDTIPRALCLSLATCPTTGIYSSNISGRKLPRVPDVQANAGLQYRQPLGNVFGTDVDLVSRVDLSITGRQFTDNTNTAFAPTRELVDASIGLNSDVWSLRLWAKNVFDHKYAAFAFTTFAGSGAGSGVTYGTLLGDRRTIGATASFKF